MNTKRHTNWAIRLVAGSALTTWVAAALAAPVVPPAAEAGRHALTIYNQNFAVVRETVPLTLTAGVNHLTFSDITSHLEPDSVILRDPAGLRTLQVLEQNYRSDPISEGLLLNRYEGQTIDFQVTHGDKTEIVKGKIVRSGYVIHNNAFSYGQSYYGGQMGYANGGAGQPLIEVNGRLQFTLPGLPLFPALSDDSILKPILDWTVQTDRAGPLNAELAYITEGMTWKADYNLVSPEVGNSLDMVGWVTMDNQSGKSFDNARIKLMAGDVSKIQPQGGYNPYGGGGGGGYAGGGGQAAVSEKAFDEYHLYTLQRPTTLRDRETKQVEFVHASGIPSSILYVYDGAALDSSQSNYSDWQARTVATYGTQSNTKVSVFREIVNSAKNGLGIPLPKGRVRFYRRDADGHLEFIGENTIDHTPKDETLRVYTGNTFDLVGERRQTDFHSNNNNTVVTETFEVRVRNHKAVPVEFRVVEHLYRGLTWTIEEHSQAFTKTDAHTIEFRVPVAPNAEGVVTYTAHYTW